MLHLPKNTKIENTSNHDNTFRRLHPDCDQEVQEPQSFQDDLREISDSAAQRRQAQQAQRIASSRPKGRWGLLRLAAP